MTVSDHRPTHFYDTRLRGIACGQAQPDDHSTKHLRSVTCPACIASFRRDRVGAEAPALDQRE